MKSIAIIPARIGSKRIKEKNIKSFLGKPIITYVIEEIKKAKIFEDVFVSTDSEKIANIAINAGAKVPFLRDSNLADDYTDTISVIADAIKQIEGILSFDLVCAVYATAPLLKSHFLRESKQICESKPNGFVVSVSEYSHPISRSFTLDKSHVIKNNQQEDISKRTQDLQKHYHDAGQFYFGHKTSFLSEKMLITDQSYGYIIPKNLVCDIDDEQDWKLAESIYKYNNNLN